jgi:thiol-disulfide isomerase/thioredoxin
MKLNILLLILCVAAGLGWTLYHDQKPLSDPILKAAPIFEAKTFNGQNIALSDYHGRVTLIHFWATWCPPCIVEFPTLVDLAKEDENLTVLAIAVKDRKKDIDRFIAKNKIILPENLIIALDADKAISETLYGTVKLPESYLLTPDHKISRKIIGAENNWNSLRWKKRIQKLQKSERVSE